MTAGREIAGAVAISVGGACNNRCSFCDVGQGAARREPSLETIAAQVREAIAAGAGRVRLTGGEATVRADFPRLLREMRLAGRPWSLTTNGRMFAYPRFLEACLAAGMTGARVTLLGHDAASHDGVAGAAAFSQTLAGLRRLHLAGALEAVNVVVGTFNIDSIDAVVETVRGVTEAPVRCIALRSPAVGAAGPDAARAAIARAEALAALPAIPVDVLSDPAVFRVAERLAPFDLARCRFRAAGQGPEDPSRTLLLAGPGAVTVCRAAPGTTPPPDTERLAAGGAWRSTGEGERRRLVRAERCDWCPVLWRCGGLFEAPPATTPAQPAGREGEALQWAGRFAAGARAFPAFRDAVERMTPGERVVVREPAPGCLAAGHERETPGDGRRGFVRPAAVARAARRLPLRLVDTLSPEEIGDDAWEMLFERLAAPPPVSASGPKVAAVMVTRACPARCVMCNIPEHFHAGDPPLPRLLRTLDELAVNGFGHVDLFGGEPMLRADLSSVIRHARRRGLYVSFNTTGLRCSPEAVARLAEAGVDKVAVALDSPRAEAHDAVKRAPGLFNAARKAIDHLLAAGSIQVEVNSVILPETLRDLPALVDLVASTGVRRQHVFHLVRSPEAAPEGLMLTPEQAREFLVDLRPRMRARAAARGLDLGFCPDIPCANGDTGEWAARLSRGVYNDLALTGVRCPAPESELFVTVEGDVYPCVSPSVWGRVPPVGNVNHACLAHMLSSPAWASFAADAGSHAGCSNCIRNCRAEPPAG